MRARSYRRDEHKNEYETAETSLLIRLSNPLRTLYGYEKRSGLSDEK